LASLVTKVLLVLVVLPVKRVSMERMVWLVATVLEVKLVRIKKRS
jgi:hypothetical protein